MRLCHYRDWSREELADDARFRLALRDVNDEDVVAVRKQGTRSRMSIMCKA